jgi:hypothetical protein
MKRFSEEEKAMWVEDDGEADRVLADTRKLTVFPRRHSRNGWQKQFRRKTL